MSKRKRTIDEVKFEFEKRNYILLDDTYIDNKTNMRYLCKIHIDKEQTIRLGNLLSGKGCKFCAIDDRANKKRNSIDKIINTINAIGFEIVNPEKYKNNSSILKFKCENGHEFEMQYNNLLNRKFCRICENSSFPITKEYANEFVENRGYELIKFIDSQSNITIKCQEGHVTKIGWDRFKIGQECVKCTGNERFNFNYKNTHQKLDFICKDGHEGSMSLHSVLAGHGCSACRFTKATQTMVNNGTVNTSKQQKFIHSIIGGKLNFQINKFVLDIAYPNEKIYLEYDGGGHFLEVILGGTSIEKFKRKELIRSKILQEKGWKEIRIVSKLDRIPTKDKLLELLDYAKKYLETGRHYIIFDLDQEIVKSSKFEKYYNYGKLKKLNEKTLDNII
jgi:very-short-patch-repair endonuclease